MRILCEHISAAQKAQYGGAVFSQLVQFLDDGLKFRFDL